MPIVRGHSLDPEILGTAAVNSSAAVAERENVVRSYEARQQALMQAAQIQSHLATVAQASQDRERDRQMDWHRTLFGAQADQATRAQAAGYDQQRYQQQYQAQADRDAQQRQYEEQTGADNWNQERLKSKQEWIDNGLRDGKLRLEAPQKAERQRLYAAISKVRTDPRLQQHERVFAESKLIDQLNAIEPMPVPADEIPPPQHEQMNKSTLRLTPKGWAPIGDTPLEVGEEYRVPDGSGGFVDKVYREHEYKAKIAAEEREQQAAIDIKKKQAEASDPAKATEAAAKARADYSRRYADAARALKSAETGEDGKTKTIIPKHDEIVAFIKQQDEAFREAQAAQSQGSANGAVQGGVAGGINTALTAPFNQPQSSTAEFNGRQYPIITDKYGRRGIDVDGVFHIEE